MEKGANISSGFSVKDKKTSSDSRFTKMEYSTGSPEAFPSKSCVHNQENHLGRPFVGGDDGGGGGVGPISCNSNSGGANEVMSMGNIYSSFPGETYAGDGISSSSSTSANLQPFHIFPSSYAYTKSPGMAAASGGGSVGGFPFTSAQWKELERQAMIYKYMISSVPVPHDLLFPLLSHYRTDPSPPSVYNVRYSKNGDPEPGRCKRTDGKKWRCSREVAPHQKYCERHLHRGRPRSRKPVEVKNNNGEIHKKSRLEQIPLPKSAPAPASASASASSQQLFTASEPLLLFNTKSDLNMSTAPSSYKGTNRDIGLMMEGMDHHWQNLMEPHMGLTIDYGSSPSIFNHDYVGNHQPFNLYSFSNFPDSVSEPPVGFIDAWSMDNLNNSSNGNNPKSSVSPNDGNLSPSLNLSMAMAAGEILDEQMSGIQVETDSKSCEDDDHKQRDFQWLSPVSWEPFPPGGPLAEALHPGSVAIGSSNPASPYDSIGSAPATTVSSPSGVLNRTPFSMSDSSVCNSPTFGAQVSHIRGCIPVAQLD